MKRLKAIRVRVYPTPEQERSFLRIAGCCRLVYNLGLIQRRDFWRQYRNVTGRGIGWHGQKRELTDLKALPEADFLREAPSHCLQMALQDLDTAYARFFGGLAGYPRPRRKGENDAFTFPDPAQIRVDVRDGRLVLPKFGRRRGDGGALRVRMHRRPFGELRRVTVSREGKHWYASILMRTRARQPQLPAPTAPDVVGIDRGVAAPFVTSGGASFGAATEGEHERKKQRRLSKALSRTQRGSRRREKARLRLLTHKSKMARRRRDRIHKITTELAKNHRIVAIEKLRVQAMTASARGTVEAPGRNVAQKGGLNREILDRGWGEFRRQLVYKLAWRGGQLLEVPAVNTSRTCAACGHVAAESRTSRDLFRCVACAHEDDADRNAAIEIRRRGLMALGLHENPAGTVGTARGALCDGMAMNREKKNDGINAKTSVDA
ncbi:MAG: transposase [Roseibium sp.]|uniref:RNA-guided endonuclease InsQ/TnpB family protein n=1 Tax=Roseibium sp. TaxID=1936156 RepID=UPI003298A179